MKSESKNRLKMINLIRWDGIKGGRGRGKRSRKKMENNIDSIVKKERNGIKSGINGENSKIISLRY